MSPTFFAEYKSCLEGFLVGLNKLSIQKLAEVDW